MVLAWLLVAAATSAHADLYRWVDPATGSVKYSNSPPNDPAIEPDVVRYKPPPSPKPAAGTPTKPTPLAELEGRWRALLTQLARLTPQELQQGGEDVRQQLQTYEAVRTELDRLDPAGAGRRASEATALLERVKQGSTR